MEKSQPSNLRLDQKEKKIRNQNLFSSTTDQKSTRWEEKSGIGDDRLLVLDGEGQGREKPPIRTTLLSPCRLDGRIPAVSFARAAVYSTSNSAMITTEIMIDIQKLEDSGRGICRRRRRIYKSLIFCVIGVVVACEKWTSLSISSYIYE